ncbi:hypothetical protein E5F05_10235 [Deinococcus metallilatus]|uniref:Uncharacterized protein n=1 Tax=Deinococcus metallilatus TaxID=1211322 RepID=A0AAJ5JY52_9DEIO|nr:hypothetical protein [Deinococcus metallilatus]MBB5295877.1 hypothetical protein [Deinococcus metallilatus]QBY08284.1 hypothetical protein E5F05_10235 [Deinococcus metallilatus]RXJ12015.1 hypothetical protein ERJ73_09045 [Deinococcus metallilatus]TLK25753.1 hypothetical protein FCS05_11935 [Deinococcus metallilatus]GMA14589.1 hypothetical protein GCM10025871_09200 [Deinococcus metallilatus]
MPTRSRQVRRPSAAHFTLFSRGRVYGVFDSLSDVQQCMARLLEQGLGEQAVQIIVGEEGQQALDVEGHGLWGRFLRLMQGMTDERPHIEQYVHALSRGEVVLSVDLTGYPGGAAAVAEAFRESHAHFVNHYGPWVVEPLNA